MKSIEHYLKPGAIVPVNNETTKALVDALKEAREALAQPSGSVEQEPKCNPHPKAPHGFNRNASHANDRYTCECEGWDAYEAGRLDGIAQEQAMYEVQRLGQEIQPEQEPVTWRNAAIRVGEDLCSVGPFGYYDMTAAQWLDWALSVVTVHAPPQRTWVGLTDDEIEQLPTHLSTRSKRRLFRHIDAKLMQKNGFAEEKNT